MWAHGVRVAMAWLGGWRRTLACGCAWHVHASCMHAARMLTAARRATRPCEPASRADGVLHESLLAELPPASVRSLVGRALGVGEGVGTGGGEIVCAGEDMLRPKFSNWTLEGETESVPGDWECSHMKDGTFSGPPSPRPETSISVVPAVPTAPKKATSTSNRIRKRGPGRLPSRTKKHHDTRLESMCTSPHWEDSGDQRERPDYGLAGRDDDDIFYADAEYEDKWGDVKVASRREWCASPTARILNFEVLSSQMDEGASGPTSGSVAVAPSTLNPAAAPFVPGYYPIADGSTEARMVDEAMHFLHHLAGVYESDQLLVAEQSARHASIFYTCARTPRRALAFLQASRNATRHFSKRLVGSRASQVHPTTSIYRLPPSSLLATPRYQRVLR